MGAGVGAAVGAGLGAGVAAGEGVGRPVRTGVGTGEAVARAVGAAVGAAVGTGVATGAGGAEGFTLAVGTGVGAGDGVAGFTEPGGLGVRLADDRGCWPRGAGASDTDWVRCPSVTEGGALVDSGVVGTGSGLRVARLSGSSRIATAGRYPGSDEAAGFVSTIRARTMETVRPTPIPMNV